MTTLNNIPVIPLRDTVLFPGTPTLVKVGRPGTVDSLKTAEATEEQLVFVVTQKSTSEKFEAEDLHSLGVIARIIKVNKRDDVYQVLIEGLTRGAALRYRSTEAGGFEALVKEVAEIPPPDPDEITFVALAKELRQKAIEAGEKFGLPEDVIRAMLTGIESPGSLADAISNSLDLTADEKQELLEELNVETRVRKVLVHVQHSIHVFEAQKDIRKQVQKSLGDRQREAVLREQMDAIRKELGDSDDEAELVELKKKIAELDLPETARKEAERQLRRLNRNAQSMDAQVARSYLETIVELPWNVETDDKIDLANAEKILEEDHYGLEDVKDRILEFLAVRKLQLIRESEQENESKSSTDEPAEKVDALSNNPKNIKNRAPILLFAGPPGVGKTSIAKSIARAMGRKYARIALGGVRDEADIRGHRRTYVGAMPGRIIHALREAGSSNPVILLDEVDKISSSFHGNPSAALLEVLDPAQNDTFVDHYLGVPFDLSKVLFIATANFLENIPRPLLDRTEIVSFRGYTEAEKLEIGKRYIVPRQSGMNALPKDSLTLSEEGLSEVITYYTREAGVRQLERVVGKLARKVARKLAVDDSQSFAVDRPEVRELLGRPKIKPERASLVDQIGVGTGMYYTPMGGDIMFVEISTSRGKGRLTLTGQLGDVMKESAQAAWSYAKSHADVLGIKSSELARDIHVHVPAGAIPKDGPSAGVTIISALVSVLTGNPIRRDLAMSGEVTLTGRVLPVGGIKEKVLGAVRAGIRNILLPQENAADLEDLPEDVRATLRVTFADDVETVLKTALVNPISPIEQDEWEDNEDEESEDNDVPKFGRSTRKLSSESQDLGASKEAPGPDSDE